MSTTPPVEVLLGCDPQVIVRLTEDDGNIIIRVTAADPAVTDIDALFFNLTDDSVLPDLNIWPKFDEAIGSNGENVTGFDAAIGTQNQLNNGAQVQEAYDCKIEYGTEPYTTGGDVDTAALTFWIDSSSGLSIDDIDLTNMTAVINSDSGNGLALTNGGSGGNTTEVTQAWDAAALFAGPGGPFDPSDAKIFDTHDQWYIEGNNISANGCADGTLELAQMNASGPVSLTLDGAVRGLNNFENGGQYGDELRIEVQIDGGEWVTLDTFRVDQDAGGLVGDQTGQVLTEDGSQLTYSGGLLDTATDSAQFRITADFTAYDEQVSFSGIEMTSTQTTGATVPVETVVAEDDFFDAGGLVASQGRWNFEDGALTTDGCDDGCIWFEEVATGGDTKIEIDARAPNVHEFEAGGCYGDSLEVWALVDGDSWHMLDTFIVNADGTALVGSETGQQIGADTSSLTWSGGALDGAETVQIAMRSDISARNEQIEFDDLTISVCEELPLPVCDCACEQYDITYDEYGKLADQDDGLDEVLL